MNEIKAYCERIGFAKKILKKVKIRNGIFKIIDF
jgi:hypothetical protein